MFCKGAPAAGTASERTWLRALPLLCDSQLKCVASNFLIVGMSTLGREWDPNDADQLALAYVFQFLREGGYQRGGSFCI